jgi:hypothetical protein
MYSVHKECSGRYNWYLISIMKEKGGNRNKKVLCWISVGLGHFSCTWGRRRPERTERGFCLGGLCGSGSGALNEKQEKKERKKKKREGGGKKEEKGT